MENNLLFIANQFNNLKSLTDLEKKTIKDNSKPHIIKKGAVLFFEKERLSDLFSITKGAYKFTFIDDKGKEHITQILGKGDLMGRRSIITNKGSMVTATALSDSLIYSLSKKIIQQNIKENNNFCQDVLKGFILDTEDEVEKITYFQNNRKIKVRLAGLLLYLSKKFGTQQKGWLNITLRRKDIANILGTTSEYIISLLTSFKEKKYVSIEGGKIKINSDKKLLALFNSK